MKLPGATTIGTIDESGLLTLNWTPEMLAGGYSAYAGWNIWLTPKPNGTPELQSVNGSMPTGLEFGGTNDSRSFETTVAAGEWAVNMQAVAASTDDESSDKWSDAGYDFPKMLYASQVTVDRATAAKNQPVVVRLDGAYQGADMWRVLFQDGSATSWLPMSVTSKVVTFQNSGNQILTVEVLNDYSGSATRVQLLRHVSISVYVMDVDYSPTQADESLTGTLEGFGGTQGFEITGTDTKTSEPYAVAVRALVRDTVTNELKMLVVSSRTADASSLIGTMAADVFPFIGRPHSKDVMEIPASLFTKRGDTLVPVKITTQLLSNGVSPIPSLIVGKPMDDFQMAVDPTSGTAPYSWYAKNLPFGLRLNVDGTLTGTPMSLGAYSVDFVVEDNSNPPFIDTVTLPLIVSSDLQITSITLPDATVMKNYLNADGSSVKLSCTGGLPPYTWKKVAGDHPQGLIIDGASGIISGNPATYNSTTDFSKTFTFTVEVTDSIGAKASAVLSMKLKPAPLSLGPVQQSIFAGEKNRLCIPIYGGQSPYSLVSISDSQGLVTSSNAKIVDGRIEVTIAPTAAQAGKSPTLSAIVADTNTPDGKLLTAKYTILPGLGSLTFSECYFNEYFEIGAAPKTISINILGDLQGFTPSLNSAPDNGVVIALDAAQKKISATEPATSAKLSNVLLQMALVKGGTTQGYVSRPFTLPAYDPTMNVASVDAAPIGVGETVGVNPLKPSINSPEFSFETVAGAQGGDVCLVRVKQNSELPRGLSLDANSGLIYGILADAALAQSKLEYLRNGVVFLTLTINWHNHTSPFYLAENLASAELQVPYGVSKGTITAPGTIKLPNGAQSFVAFGRLPLCANGSQMAVALGSDQKSLVLSGTPIESGFFDVWFQAADTNNNVAYLYKRFVVSYTTPLILVTESIESPSTGQDFTQQMTAFGGVPFVTTDIPAPHTPYNWQLTVTKQGGGAPGGTGFAIDANGLITGNTTDANGTVYTFSVTVTDKRGVSVTTDYSVTINNTLRIITTVLPNAVLNGQYDYTLQARGGTPPYKLFTQTNAGSVALPVSIVFDGTTGHLSGAVNNVPGNQNYDQHLLFTVTDNANVVSAAKDLELKVTAGSGMGIDYSGCGTIYRGQQYLGTLKPTGTGLVGPYKWEVSKLTVDQLPQGLSINPDTGDVTGTTTFKGTKNVMIHVVDQGTGNDAFAVVPFVTASNLKITTTSLPGATANGSYSTFLKASGGVPNASGQYTWAHVGLTKYTLNANTGEISGVDTAVETLTFNITVTDTIGDTATASFTIKVTSTTLAISPATLPQWKVGVQNSVTFVASGGTGSGYTWFVDDDLEDLPAGLTLNQTTGLLSGTTSAARATAYSIRIRLVDSSGAYVTKDYQLTVQATLSLSAGPDSVNGTSNGYIGFVCDGNVSSSSPSVRPNSSFYVIASGIVAVNPADIIVTVSVDNGAPVTISAFVQTLTSYPTGGVAKIRLDGNFKNGVKGDNPITVTLKDNSTGAQTQASFKWNVYSIATPTLKPGSGSFPTRVVN